MKLHVTLATILLLSPLSASADPSDAQSRLMALPHADVSRLIGSWEVEEMKPARMIYEFRVATMAMHGRDDRGGSTFELTLDADYRLAGENAVWIIGTHPRPIPEGTEENAANPSIMGVELTSQDHAKLTVSAGERFTLIRVPPESH